MKFKTGVLLFVIGSIAANVFSASLEDLLDSRYAVQLRSDESPITEIQLRNPSPKLLPRHIDLQRFIAETISSLEPNILVETLYRYQKPESAGWNEAERTGLYNQIVALSTLTGIQYYSASRKTMRVFYESSQVIDGPDTKRAIPDPAYPLPPLSLTIYARQKDLTFGDNIYRYEYRTTTDAFFFLQENLTSLNYGIIQAVGKNRLRSTVAVIDTGDSLLIYAASMAKAVSVFGMGDRIGASFSNRAEAVLKWFAGRADRVFKTGL